MAKALQEGACGAAADRTVGDSGRGKAWVAWCPGKDVGPGACEGVTGREAGSVGGLGGSRGTGALSTGRVWPLSAGVGGGLRINDTTGRGVLRLTSRADFMRMTHIHRETEVLQAFGGAG